MAEGVKMEAIADRLGVQRNLLHYWLQGDEDFAAEWNRLAGRKQANAIEWRDRIHER